MARKCNNEEGRVRQFLEDFGLSNSPVGEIASALQEKEVAAISNYSTEVQCAVHLFNHYKKSRGVDKAALNAVCDYFMAESGMNNSTELAKALKDEYYYCKFISRTNTIVGKVLNVLYGEIPYGPCNFAGEWGNHISRSDEMDVEKFIALTYHLLEHSDNQKKKVRNGGGKGKKIHNGRSGCKLNSRTINNVKGKIEEIVKKYNPDRENYNKLEERKIDDYLKQIA